MRNLNDEDCDGGVLCQIYTHISGVSRKELNQGVSVTNNLKRIMEGMPLMLLNR